MAIKNTVAKQTETKEIRASKIDFGLISKVMILWGMATAIQGILIAYTMTTELVKGAAAGINLASLVAFPYELNLLGGVLNLLFGIALFALGRKAKNW